MMKGQKTLQLRNKQNKLTIYFVLASLFVGAALFAIRYISVDFPDDQPASSHPFKLFVSILICANCCWIVSLQVLRQNLRLKRSVFATLILLGILYRAIFLSSTPIYENDFHRYMWDGAVAVSGQNPYAYPPEATFKIRPETPEAVKKLRDLTEDNNRTVTLIGYPELTTIYPPLVITVFAVASIVDPFNLDVLRLIYLFFDGLAFWVLVKCLRHFGRPPSWAFVYWLNPLMIFLTYNAAHMDVLLIAPMLGAITFVKTKPIWSAFLIGIAASMKFWPLMLAPVIFRKYLVSPKRYAFLGSIAGLTCLVLVSPMLFSMQQNSGLLAYATDWNKNSFVFSLIERCLAFIYVKPGGLSRLIIAFALLALTFWCVKSKAMSERGLFSSILLLTAALFFLAPAGYPWYFIWILPVLCFVPSYGVASLSVLLPLYFLRFAWAEMGLLDDFNTVIVPIEFGIPIFLMAVEFYMMNLKASQISDDS